MNRQAKAFFSIAALLLLFLFSAQVVAVAAEPAPAKPAAKPAAKPVAKKPSASKKAPAKKGGPTIEELQVQLLTFAKKCALDMNSTIMPCVSKKEVVAQGDGYVARYLSVDLDGLTASVIASEGSKTIPYVGYIYYQEIEYTSRGKTREEALKGEFSPGSRNSFTELVKYKGGKWSY